jgi:hypothetical protein
MFMYMATATGIPDDESRRAVLDDVAADSGVVNGLDSIDA